MSSDEEYSSSLVLSEDTPKKSGKKKGEDVARYRKDERELMEHFNDEELNKAFALIAKKRTEYFRERKSNADPETFQKCKYCGTNVKKDSMSKHEKTQKHTAMKAQYEHLKEKVLKKSKR
jgi:hypothetical protein